MLGDLGFNAFVVDVYGKGIRPNTPETCQTEMMKYATNRPLLREQQVLRVRRLDDRIEIARVPGSSNF